MKKSMACNLTIFVNENSLHGQFHKCCDFEKSMEEFYSLISSMLRVPNHITTEIFTDRDTLFQRDGINGKVFAQSFNSIKNNQLSSLLKRIFFDKNIIKNWKPSQLLSSTNAYYYGNDNVTDTSMAELAERTLTSISNPSHHLLLNFILSNFATLTSMTIMKNSSSPITLNCSDNTTDIEKWLQNEVKINQFIYPDDSEKVPQDNQTILRDRKRFTPTAYLNQGRTVYIENDTDFRWCVDNMHFGKKAHLEVFDNQGKHRGEADIVNGTLDTGKATSGRRLYS